MVLETIRQDYIRMARAKGCSEGTVLFKHALTNALMPLITSIGMHIGTFFGGSVILEQLFGINGMGRMTLDALRQKDVPTIMAGVLISAVLIAVGNLVADLCYGLVDPRIRSLYYTPKKLKPLKEVA
jgi:peptide/nickel transport system permease protein